METKLTVFIEEDYSGKAPRFRAQIERLRARKDLGFRFVASPGKDLGSVVRPEDIAEADLYILMGKRRMDASSFQGLEKLQWIGRFGAGFENVDIPSCNRKGILLSNAPLGIRQPVAELVMAYIFSLTMRLPFFDRYIRSKGFAGKGEHPTRCVQGQTLGLVGAGGIARTVVELVRPLGMKVLAFDPYGDAAALKAVGVELCGLDRLLESSDYISVHVPLSPETRGMLREEHFRKMKPGAFFINTSRGGIYSDAVLARALREGWIAGAGIDVFEDEPEVMGNPLLSCDNAILTPHTAGAMNNIDSIGMVMESLVDSIFKIAEGGFPDNIVNPEASRRPVPPEKVTSSFQPR